MKTLSRILLLNLTSYFVGSYVLFADTTPPPKLGELVNKGHLTEQKLVDTPASWSVNCRIRGEEVIRIQVTHGKSGYLWDFLQIENGRPEKICELIQLNNLWYIQEKGDFAKTRPYEAELHFPAAYTFLSMSALRYLTDESQLASAHFEGRNGDKLSYSLPLPMENRRTLEAVVADYRKMADQDPSFLKRPEVAQTLQRAQEQLTNGLPFAIDEKTGIIVESKIKELTITVSDFHWLASEPSAAFRLPDGAEWSDHSEPWPESDYGSCIMVGHDPLFTGTNSSKLATDGYVLNLRTKELRRIPYQGATMMPGCFLKNRWEVVISGADLFTGPEMLKINLLTGATTKLGGEQGNGSLGLVGEASPDGKKVAAIGLFSGKSIVDFQMKLIDLQTGQMQDLGKAGRIGAPFSWLPDGDGLILKRFEQANNLNAVEQRILCRLGLDGKLVDLRPGDMPLVLRKTRKILYQDNDTDLWHTCNLDGSEPELYADGLKSYGTPAVSPDEKSIMFALYEKGKLPQLMLFEISGSKGKPIRHANGFTGLPVWR